ncbi:unnamed protein product [Microthlaspi erraticum]|uniref:Uncharacterized protein n=1 Tax=Microthlaspi erraticum TaxID=1685480 RepID=A0A6D2L8W1_9BRAS|nr:unnamed protein product [Microthlaspi erraticum]
MYASSLHKVVDKVVDKLLTCLKSIVDPKEAVTGALMGSLVATTAYTVIYANKDILFLALGEATTYGVLLGGLVSVMAGGFIRIWSQGRP